MKQADLILVASDDKLSQAIRHATRGVVSHCAGIISTQPPILTFEALDRVKTDTLGITLKNKTAAYAISDRTLSDAQREAIVTAVLSFSAESYGYADLLFQELDSLGKTTFWTDHLASLVLAHAALCSFIWPKAYEMALGEKSRGWGVIKSISMTPQDLYAAALADPARYEIRQLMPNMANAAVAPPIASVMSPMMEEVRR